MKKIIKYILALLMLPLFLMYSQSDNSNEYLFTGLSGGGVMDNIAISPIDNNIIMLTSNMTGVYLTYEGPKKWEMVHHSNLVEVSNAKACFHPTNKNIIYAPRSNGLYRSLDRGETWSKLGNIGRIEKEMVIHPLNPNLMLAGSSNSVWRSTNAGQSWTKVNGPSGKILGFNFDRTTNDVGGVCFAATTNGLWRSDDGGGTWAKKVNGLPTGTIASFAGASNKSTNSVMLYCAIGNTVYRSTNKGENWSSLSPGITGNVPFLLSSDVNPNIVYAAFSGTNVRKSTNGGQSWSSILFTNATNGSFNLEHNYFTSYMNKLTGTKLYDAAIAGGDPNFVMLASGMYCIYTDDGGVTWKNGHITPVVKSGEPKPTTFANTGLNVTTTWHYYIDPFEPERHYLAYTDIGFARSLDYGNSWLFWLYQSYQQPLPFQWNNTCYEIAFDPEIPGKMWGAFSRAHDIPNGNAIIRDHVSHLSDSDKKGGIAFSNDFAATWQHTSWNTGLPGRPAISVVLDTASPKGNRTLYASIYEDGVYKSVDDGRNWTKKSVGLGSATNMHVTRLKVHKDGTIFCLVTGIRGFSADGVGLYQSKNGGDSWEKVNKDKDFLWPRDFEVHPNNSNEIYIGAHNAGSQQGALWRTTNGGLTWTSIASKGAHFGAYLHPNRPGWIYMSLCEGNNPESGLWLSKDNGTTWLPYTKIPHRWMQRVCFDPSNDDVIYVTTFGASALKLPADPNNQLTGIYNIKANDINLFPNPCDSHLNITLKETTKPVDYKISDLSGNLMGTGSLEQTMTVIDIPYRSGLYVLSMSSGNEVNHLKFIKR